MKSGLTSFLFFSRHIMMSKSHRRIISHRRRKGWQVLLGFFFSCQKKNVFLLNSLADLSLESVRCLLKHTDSFCVDHSSHSARHRNSFFRLQRLRTARPLGTNSSLLSLFVLAQFFSLYLGSSLHVYRKLLSRISSCRVYAQHNDVWHKRPRPSYASYTHLEDS